MSQEITLELINKLRKTTGRGLYDCKIALQLTSSFEEAQEYLRKRGINLVHKYRN